MGLLKWLGLVDPEKGAHAKKHERVVIREPKIKPKPLPTPPTMAKDKRATFDEKAVRVWEEYLHRGEGNLTGWGGAISASQYTCFRCHQWFHTYEAEQNHVCRRVL